jgi:hypothetical protein
MVSPQEDCRCSSALREVESVTPAATASLFGREPTEAGKVVGSFSRSSYRGVNCSGIWVPAVVWAGLLDSA